MEKEQLKEKDSKERLKFKNLEEQAESIEKLCFTLREEGILTENMIMRGQDIPTVAVNKEEQIVFSNRYEEMENKLNSITEAIRQTQRTLKDLRTFFER